MVTQRIVTQRVMSCTCLTLPVNIQKIESGRFRVKPGKNSKKANFGIIGKQIFHRVTYPKSSKSSLGKHFYSCLNSWGYSSLKITQMQYQRKFKNALHNKCIAKI